MHKQNMIMTMMKNIRSALIAAGYNLIMQSTERRCLSHWRRELLYAAHGQVLEIGAGTGLNLPYYPADVKQLTLSEPDAQMRKKLLSCLRKQERAISVQPWSAEQIAMPDASYDTIVSTLVLCSVSCLSSSLNEIFRLLKPGGRLIFLEHVISDKPKIRRWQQRLEPAWSLCAGDCRLTRDTQKAIETAGLKVDNLITAPILGAPAFVSRTIRGVARKPFPDSES